MRFSLFNLLGNRQYCIKDDKLAKKNHRQFCHLMRPNLLACVHTRIDLTLHNNHDCYPITSLDWASATNGRPALVGRPASTEHSSCQRWKQRSEAVFNHWLLGSLGHIVSVRSASDIRLVVLGLGIVQKCRQAF